MPFQLYGDGVHDDTDAIQSMLDSGVCCVALPVPGKNYLISRGIDADRIRVISYGKERPAVVGANEDAWAQNRRAVTLVKD